MTNPTTSALAPTLALDSATGLEPALAACQGDFRNLPPFDVPEEEIEPWFNTARRAPNQEIRTVRCEMPYYVNVVRHFKADPETHCAQVRTYGRLDRPSIQAVRDLPEWELLKYLLGLGYPTNYFGISPYENQPGGAKPGVLAPWVKVAITEWTLPERTRFLDRKAMRHAPTATLVWQFAQAVAENERYRHYGKKAYRNLRTVIEKLTDEFNARGGDAQRQLGQLARHDDPYVSLEGARLALEFGDEARALPALERLAADPGLHVQSLAEMTRDGWRRLGPRYFEHSRTFPVG